MGEHTNTVTPEVFWVVDSDLRYEMFVGEAVEHMEVGQNEIVGKNLLDFYDEDDLVIVLHRRALSGKFGMRYETDWAGRTYFARLSPIPAGPARTGKIRGVAGMALDVTNSPTAPDRQIRDDLQRATSDIIHVSRIADAFGISADAVRKRFQRGDFPQRKLGGKWVMTRRQLQRLVEGGGDHDTGRE
ncbi:MAG: PAS domain-containing protein [Planctomycetota bacterium]